MNYGLRYWLMILAFLLGFFHGPRAARGHDLPYSIVGRNGDTVWLEGEYAFHIHPSLTTEDVRRMIDSAMREHSRGQSHYNPHLDTIHWIMPGVMAPDSCMSIDTVWTLEHVSTPNVAYFRRTIDTTWTTEGPCDD